MQQIYKFTDWTSASRMKNSIDKTLKIDVTVISNGEQIQGYQLTVYNSITQRSVYKFYIDYSNENTWTLSTSEAIEALNLIGFNCEFDMEHYELVDDVIVILKALKDLGYTHIMREIRPSKVRAYKYDDNHKIPRLDDISKITDYNYHDFWMVDTTLTPIDFYLNTNN